MTHFREALPFFLWCWSSNARNTRFMNCIKSFFFPIYSCVWFFMALLTQLFVVFLRCLTWSVQAQTIFSFTWSKILLLTYFTKSGYFSHTFLRSITTFTFHASIILSSITLHFMHPLFFLISHYLWPFFCLKLLFVWSLRRFKSTSHIMWYDAYKVMRIK